VTANLTRTGSGGAVEPIGIAENYLGLVAALRARVRELGIPYETIDALAGFQERYASKLLAEEPLKFMGAMSLDAMLGVLAVKIALIPDPARLEKIKRHRDYVPHKINMRERMRSAAAGAYIAHRVTREFLRQIGRKGGLATREKLSARQRKAFASAAARAKAEKLTPEERSASARKASLARWRKPREIKTKYQG
jgi:hypothetical protein